MARPTFTLPAAGIQGWDAIISDDFEILLEGPWPVYQKTAGNESNLTATFPPGSYDRCILFVNHSTLGWIPYYSNGTIWIIIPKQGTAIVALTDSSGGTANNTLQNIGAIYSQAEVANNFADLAAKVNELRTVLIASGALAP